jgi:hypothetical protein
VIGCGNLCVPTITIETASNKTRAMSPSADLAARRYVAQQTIQVAPRS